VIKGEGGGLVTAGSPVDRARAVGYLGGRHVEGVLLVSSRAGNPITDDLIAAGVPTVVCLLCERSHLCRDRGCQEVAIVLTFSRVGGGVPCPTARACPRPRK